MGLFKRRREDGAEIIRDEINKALTEADEGRKRDAAQITALCADALARLDKIAKRQNKLEITCEDIQESVTELSRGQADAENEKAACANVPGELFCDVLESYELLARFCEKSTDGELAGQTARLNAKVYRDMEKRGFARVDQAGVRVDLNIHEVYSVEPAPDPAMANTVKQIIIAGCVHGDKTVRRAVVKAYGGETV